MVVSCPHVKNAPGFEMGPAKKGHVWPMAWFYRAHLCHSSGNAARLLKLFLEPCGWKEQIIKALSWKTSCVNTSVRFSLLICYSFLPSFAIADYSLSCSKRIFAVWSPLALSSGGNHGCPTALCSSMLSPLSHQSGIKMKWSLVFPHWTARYHLQWWELGGQLPCLAAQIYGSVICIFGNEHGDPIRSCGWSCLNLRFAFVSNLFCY